MTSAIYQEQRKLPPALRHVFWELNNDANTSNLTSANVLRDSFEYNPPINFASKIETPTNAYSIM